MTLLAIYSHMIDSFLYLPDYPLGHMIAFQIERQMEKAGTVGAGVRADGEAGQHRARPLDEAAPPARPSAPRRSSPKRRRR